MTMQTVEAVYEQGAFRLVQSPVVPFREGQRVRIVVDTQPTTEDVLALATSVFDGLSEQDIQDIDTIACKMIKTIQMTIDGDLLAEVDRVTENLQTNRSAFIRSALQLALRQHRIEQLEQQHLAGYARSPMIDGGSTSRKHRLLLCSS